MTGEAPPEEVAPGTSSLETIRRRLEFPGLSRGPRWLRWVLWLRWLVVPAILAIVLWAGDWDWAGDFPADVGRDVGREIDNVIDWMTTGVVGTASWAPCRRVWTREMASTTSIPSTTSPNTA